jgi:hypothetical protein
MRSQRKAALFAFCVAFAAASNAFAQGGLRLPERGEPGLDPSFARGWLAPDYDTFGFARYQWRDASGFTPGSRMNWSYSFGNRGTLGMGMANGRDALDPNQQLSLFGRYSLTHDWALSAEMWRDPAGGLRPQDLRIGVQRRF